MHTLLNIHMKKIGYYIFTWKFQTSMNNKPQQFRIIKIICSYFAIFTTPIEYLSYTRSICPNCSDLYCYTTCFETSGNSWLITDII